MSVETLQLVVSMAGLLLAAVGLPLVYAQLRDVQRSIRASTHAAVYEQAADLRAHLVEYPHLREFFFGGTEIAVDHADYDRVVTIAELFLNYLEHIAVLSDSFGKANLPALHRFVRVAMEQSPILRKHLSNNRAAYSDALHAIVSSHEDAL